jgi:hypothetical protein
MLPGGDRAVVDPRKLVLYCLNPDHPRGKHKARVFLSRLGLTAADAHVLRRALLSAADNQPAIPGERDEHGQRYVLDFRMVTDTGQATVRSTWIVRTGEDFPRLTSCYVL